MYRATASMPSGERAIALKEFRFEDSPDSDAVERFVDAVEAWDRLDDHEHVVDILELGAEPVPWIATEYMDGVGSGPD